ncbi:MAG: hypothetical protein IPJ84_01765 [Bdellovibrionales bacterium]|nr:hypothetical protein [Bdellovibrionales bacterium]
MSMIKGKIETDREVAPKEINFGKTLAHKNDSGNWVSNDPDFDVVETDLDKMLEEISEQDLTELTYKKSARSADITI